MKELLRAALALFVLGGCGDDAAAVEDPPVTWDCPAGWVVGEHGGCGPAVLLCAGEGATTNACDEADLSVPAPGSGFFRTAGGEPAGGWTAAVPAPDWMPSAGIPSCPDGWRRTEDGVCDPMLPEDCPAGSEPIPGGGCTGTAGGACATGEYADVTAEAGTDPIVHLRAGADPALADGSRDRPYATIDAALAALAGGGWLLVGAGEHTGRIWITPGSALIHVVGTCAARVTIRLEDTASPTVAAQAGLDLRGLTLAGGRWGVTAQGGARVTLRGIVVEGSMGRGIFATGRGTAIDAQDVIVRSSLLIPEASGGIWAENGGAIQLRRTVVHDQHETGLVAYSGATIDASDSVVRDLRPQPTGRWGQAAWAEAASRITAERVVFSDNPAELIANGERTAIDLTDCVVREVRAARSAMPVAGLAVSMGATLSARRVLVEDADDVSVLSAGGRLVLEDSHVRTVEPSPTDHGSCVHVAGTAELTRVVVEGCDGNGIWALDGGLLVARSTVVRSMAGLGVVAGEAGSTMDLEDVVVEDVGIGSNHLGVGLALYGGARVTARRVRVSRATGAAIAVAGGSELVLEDARIESTRPDAAAFARGIESSEGARAVLNRTFWLDHADAGVLATAGGTLEITDSRISASRSDDGVDGHGLVAGLGGRLTARRVWIDAATEAGVAAFERGTEMDLEDVIVDGVTPSSRGFGAGVASFGATVRATRLAVSRVRGAGILAVPYRDTVTGATLVASVGAIDLWVRDVRSSTLGFAADGRTPEGRAVAYGIHAGQGCTASATRFVVAEGGFGFFSSGGAIDLLGGLITFHADAAGATSSSLPDPTLRTEQVYFRDNAVDEVVAAPSDLPQASSLPPPSTICLAPPCSE